MSAPNGAMLPTTRRRMPTSCSFSTSCSSAARNSCFNTETSSAGRRQFSELKANKVKNSTPRSAHARTVARTASPPRLWPATRGRKRCFAQRPLPSMMMAMWRGTAPTSGIDSVVLSNFGMPSDLHQVGFLLLQQLVHLRDVPVGQLLHLILRPALLVLGDGFRLEQLLEVVVR